MNKFIGIGRLTKDPELIYTSTEVAVASFDIAINRKFTNKDGEKETDFFRVVVWRKQGENVKKYCKKGDLIAIEGEVQNRTYEDKDGDSKRITEIIASSVEFLSQKSKESNDVSDEASNEEETKDSIEDPYADFGDTIELTDDDLPF